MNKRSLPDTGITIILMGTNDVKLGETEKAMKNLRKIATKTDNRTQYPPLKWATQKKTPSNSQPQTE